MKNISISVLAVLFSIAAQAAPQKITCSYQWKNAGATPNEFSFRVEALGTSRAKVLLAPNAEGEMLQVISGVKDSEHQADAMLREVGVNFPAEVFTSAKDDIAIQIGDGVSTEIFIKIYKNSRYTSGFMTLHCDESYCGEFDYYSVLKCK